MRRQFPPVHVCKVFSKARQQGNGEPRFLVHPGVRMPPTGGRREAPPSRTPLAQGGQVDGQGSGNTGVTGAMLARSWPLSADGGGTCRTAGAGRPFPHQLPRDNGSSLSPRCSGLVRLPRHPEAPSFTGGKGFGFLRRRTAVSP